jgi:hypothetical protein
MKQRFELKAMQKKSKRPCERCQGENKEKDAEAHVIDKQNNEVTYFCKFHATDWYATHELLVGCKISICEDLSTKDCGVIIGMEVKCPVDCVRGNKCEYKKIRKLREKIWVRKTLTLQ